MKDFEIPKELLDLVHNIAKEAYEEGYKDGKLDGRDEVLNHYEIGDEVIFKNKLFCITRHTTIGWAKGMDEYGSSFDIKLSECCKTGRHFSQIKDILNWLKDKK